VKAKLDVHKRIIVGISGASGVIYGIRLLEFLKDAGVETHAVISGAAKKNIRIETKFSVAEVEKLAGTIHDEKNMAASISAALSGRTEWSWFPARSGRSPALPIPITKT
jgi:polyprenyl P-hydroxybenzoate/phenylacrylic acid decarboxylase-like protein